MNIDKNARLSFHGRVLLVKRIIDEHWKIAEAAEAAGTSARTASKWLARFRAGGERMLHETGARRQPGRSISSPPRLSQPSRFCAASASPAKP